MTPLQLRHELIKFLRHLSVDEKHHAQCNSCSTGTKLQKQDGSLRSLQFSASMSRLASTIG